MKSLFAVGNRKLSKNVLVFSISPGITCPGRTELCERVCYSKKSDRLFKRTRKKRFLNFKKTLRNDFVKLVLKELKKKPQKLVRIHESGDFYNQKYLNKWIEIARSCPEKTFLAYTKSFHLDFSGIPDNFILYYSVDPTTKGSIPKGNIAYLVPRGQKEPEGYETCSHKASKKYCGSECFKCWNRFPKIYFKQH